LRVMYREGPEGTPYHSLCMDGLINGPMATALCVGWEAPLYKQWSVSSCPHVIDAKFPTSYFQVLTGNIYFCVGICTLPMSSLCIRYCLRMRTHCYISATVI
jgi:hypothetical protein